MRVDVWLGVKIPTWNATPHNWSVWALLPAELWFQLLTNDQSRRWQVMAQVLGFLKSTQEAWIHVMAPGFHLAQSWLLWVFAV